MSVIKPIYVMHEQGLNNLEKNAVLDGTEELLKIGEVNNLIDIIDFGVWRNEGYRNEDGSLKEYQSVDWCLQEGRKASRNKTQLDADVLLDLLLSFYSAQEHYSILVLKSDLYYSPLWNATVVGCADLEGPGIVLSMDRFKDLDKEVRYGCIKTATMHEVGHIFGLVPYRERVIDFSHCANKCVMRPGSPVPDGVIMATKDRLKHGPLCPECETYLKNYFK